MAKAKKRDKKYNPNKMEQVFKSKLGLLYEFEMKFVIEDVNDQINAWRDENNMPDDAYCPEWLVIDTYKQQDLIIALKMQHLKSPEYWEIGIDGHFYSEAENDVYTIPFYVELPEMSHEQLMNGCEVKVNRGAGIKTRWKGLQDEMMDHWKAIGIPDGYELVKSQAYLKAQAKFKDLRMFKEHEFLLKLRDQGILIQKLKTYGRIAI